MISKKKLNELLSDPKGLARVREVRKERRKKGQAWLKTRRAERKIELSAGVEGTESQKAVPAGAYCYISTGTRRNAVFTKDALGWLLSQIAELKSAHSQMVGVTASPAAVKLAQSIDESESVDVQSEE